MNPDSPTHPTAAKTARDAPPAGPGVGAGASRKHTLLIVDDEVDVLESLRHLFHRSYRVLTAKGGDEAIALMKDVEIHLILSDQRMPGMTGDVFLSHARRMQPDAIRMLFTGYADIQAVINAVNEGHIFRYILKPWDVVELEAVIRQAADQCDLLADRRRLVAELQSANARLTAANDELAHAGELKSAFIEVASHEFNTPITLVLGLSELLRMMNPDRAESERAIVEQIVTGSRQLARLVAGTLTLMRSDDFRRTLLRAPTDFSRLLRRIAEKVRPFLELRHLTLIDDVADDLGTFELDADKIDACVVNLLTNAIKFTPDGRQIALSARLVDADTAEVVVADTGIGLDARSLNQLFRPFFTEFDPSRHSSGDFGFNKRGLGVGLSIVKQFVELHGGSVSAGSVPGEGTRVTILLPRHGAPPGTPAVEASPGTNLDAPGPT